MEPDGVSPTRLTRRTLPLVVTNATFGLRAGGELKDLMPTALDLLGIEQPSEMTGSSLVAGA